MITEIRSSMTKKRVKLIIDILMTLAMFVLMAFHFTGQLWHEITGTTMLVLFVLHHVLNRAWYKSIAKGKYSGYRVLITVMDVLMLIDILMIAVSAVSMSKYVFGFLPFGLSASLSRSIHIVAVYAGFLLMSFHIGLHVDVMIGSLVCRNNKNDTSNTTQSTPSTQGQNDKKKNRFITFIKVIMVLTVLGYGAYALINRDIIGYISGAKMFAFFDYSEFVVFFFIDYIFICAMMALMARGIAKLLKTGVRNSISIMAGDIRSHKKRYIILSVLLVIIIVLFFVFGISYIKRHFVTASVNRAEAVQIDKVDTGDKKGLIVYFTRVGNTDFDPDVDAVSSASLMEENGKLIGNSELIAEIVKNATGFDEYAITVDKKYSSSYGATVSEAGDENDSGVIRPLTEPLPDVSGYDDIILIYPLWWWTLPQPVKTWLEKTNLSGKTLHVIVTHGGSGLGNTRDDLPGYTKADIDPDMLDVFDDSVRESSSDVYAWLKKMYQ